jgi:hypothetical protein
MLNERGALVVGLEEDFSSTAAGVSECRAYRDLFRPA